jgi:hypothetical protein
LVFFFKYFFPPKTVLILYFRFFYLFLERFLIEQYVLRIFLDWKCCHLTNFTFSQLSQLLQLRTRRIFRHQLSTILWAGTMNFSIIIIIGSLRKAYKIILISKLYIIHVFILSQLYYEAIKT